MDTKIQCEAERLKLSWKNGINWRKRINKVYAFKQGKHSFCFIVFHYFLQSLVSAYQNC